MTPRLAEKTVSATSRPKASHLGSEQGEEGKAVTTGQIHKHNEGRALVALVLNSYGVSQFDNLFD